MDQSFTIDLMLSDLVYLGLLSPGFAFILVSRGSVGRDRKEAEITVLLSFGFWFF